MAKATVSTKKPEVDKVHLTLSAEEADALVTVFGYVGGSPVTTARKHIDAIDNALKFLGITREESRFRGQTHTGLGGIYFKAEDKDFATSWISAAF